MRRTWLCLWLLILTPVATEEIVPVPGGPPLPNGDEQWDPDPWQRVTDAAEPLLQVPAMEERRIGPLISAEQTWSVKVTGSKAPWTATLYHDDEAAVRSVPLQVFYRRVIIGPIGPGGTMTVEGRNIHHWILVRQGRVRLITRHGDPVPINDELEFDLRFFGVDLSALDAEQAQRWAAAWWEVEGRRMQAGVSRDPPPADDLE